jgi:hypothetical protein
MMSSESEPSDLDREVDASMRIFERSQVGPAAAVTPIRPSRILLVLDGSNQDEAGIAAAIYLRGRFNVETLVLDAQSAEQESADAAPEAAKQVSGARPIARKPGTSYDAIIAALADHAVDLVIVPCPFGRSFDAIGTDSAGTVIDVLLSRCNRPLLVIRRADQQLQSCVASVSMIVGGECDVASRAAAWAFGLAAEQAVVTLNLVIDHEQFENIRSIVEALHPETQLEPEQFAAALTKTHHALHGAMAKTAESLNLRYHFRPEPDQVAPPNPLDDARKMLLVMPLEVDDRFGQGFVQDRIRRSPHPVLIVPGHVPADLPSRTADS